MIVYGGVNQNFMQDNESTNSKTYALNLSLWPNPVWVNLSPVGNPGGRVASGHGWSPLHSAMIVSIGRDEFKAGDPVDEPPDQTIKKTTWALTCEEPQQPTPTSTVVATTPAVTVTPPTGTAETPTPVPTVPPSEKVCEFIIGKVPPQVISAALASASSVRGYGLLCNPNLPESGWNHERTNLSMEHTGLPYHPLYNSLEWKCGCP
jgi:hypothetical protein